MASTSYKARVIISEEEVSDLSKVDFAGSYKLLVAAKSVPAPASAPNTVESTTMEDDTQTFEMGIKTSDSKEVTGNLDKKYLQAINKLNGKKVKIMQLYGTDGIGGVAKYASTTWKTVYSRWKKCHASNGKRHKDYAGRTDKSAYGRNAEIQKWYWFIL